LDGISISALLGNIFFFLFGCIGPFHNYHRCEKNYLFKYDFSITKNDFSCHMQERIRKKSGLPGSTVAGFVFILVLMFALQYLIKLEVGLVTSPPHYILLKQFLGKRD
jgi:hypothetical protein